MTNFNIPMSSITLDITSDKFIVSETAKLTFSATVALTDPNIEPKSLVLSTAKEIAEGDWYVTSVHRSQDTSGIETITYGLSVRVEDKIANGINANIKNVNRAGLRYVLSGVDYAPTQTQIQEATSELRRETYTKANDELAILNAANRDSDEQWVVGSIDFTGAPVMAKALRVASTQMYADAAQSEDTGVTQKLSITARVSLYRKIYSRL